MRWISMVSLVGCVTVVEDYEVCAIDHPHLLQFEDREAVPVLADESVTFTFAPSAGGCSTLGDAFCEVELVEDRLVVTTWAEVRSRVAVACESALIVDYVTCESPPLPAGTYTIVVGTDEATLVVPSESDPICVGP